VTCAFRVVSKYLVSVYVLLLGYQYHQYYCELWSFRLDLVYWSWSNFLNTQELFRAVVSVDWTCIWPSGCHCHSLSLASVKFRSVLPFWYWLTRVVPEKGLLNGCVWVCVCRLLGTGEHADGVLKCWFVCFDRTWHMNWNSGMPTIYLISFIVEYSYTEPCTKHASPHYKLDHLWHGAVRDHSRSSVMSPFDSAHMTSYSTLTETMRLSCTVFNI